jgi:hypothetical protein
MAAENTVLRGPLAHVVTTPVTRKRESMQLRKAADDVGPEETLVLMMRCGAVIWRCCDASEADIVRPTVQHSWLLA